MCSVGRTELESACTSWWTCPSQIVTSDLYHAPPLAWQKLVSHQRGLLVSADFSRMFKFRMCVYAHAHILRWTICKRVNSVRHVTSEQSTEGYIPFVTWQSDWPCMHGIRPFWPEDFFCKGTVDPCQYVKGGSCVLKDRDNTSLIPVSYESFVVAQARRTYNDVRPR